MSSQKSKASEIVFFLGAGASVKAEVPDTFSMIEKFKERISSKPQSLTVFNKVMTVLKEWKKDQKNNDERIDVELLLETLDKLEKRNQENLLRFYEGGKYILERYPEKKPLKEELKDFIKDCGVVKAEKIQYLEPLLGFTTENTPLDIFSVNYDICIEQLCNLYKKEYTDGFDNKWHPELLEEQRFDIRLFKLHGSVMWYNTDRADYVKLQIKTKKAETTLITGERASTLILYPMRKWEYSGPTLELLTYFKKKLEKAKFVFVIGYSFRDLHIRRIFWDAARKNKDLIVFLITPEAHEIYHNKLEHYETPELSYTFSSHFDPRIFDAPPRSELSGRVVTLPYKFENILPMLKSNYLHKMREAVVNEQNLRKSELQGGNVDWWHVFTRFIECEHMQKVKEILNKISWSELIKNKGWNVALETSFKALLTTLATKNLNDAKKWLERTTEFFQTLNVEKLSFDPMRDPPEIRMLFRYNESSGISSEQLLKTIEKLLEASNRKTILMKGIEIKEIKEIHERIESLHSYLSQFPQNLRIWDYLALRRKNYSPEITNLKIEYGKFIKTYSKEQMNTIISMLKEIEKKELVKIYGGQIPVIKI